MTKEQKAELKRETAQRLREPYSDALEYLAKCRAALHELAPHNPQYAWSRKQLYISAKSWVREARASRYCVEAAQPDAKNDRTRAVA